MDVEESINEEDSQLRDVEEQFEDIDDQQEIQVATVSRLLSLLGQDID